MSRAKRKVWLSSLGGWALCTSFIARAPTRFPTVMRSSPAVQFSSSSIAERLEAGYRDMRAALAAERWLRQERPAHLGAAGAPGGAGMVTTRPEPNLHTMIDKPAAA